VCAGVLDGLEQALCRRGAQVWRGPQALRVIVKAGSPLAARLRRRKVGQ